MDLSILKNQKGSVLASLLILLVGCESPTEPTNIDPATVTVTMERIPNIELNDYQICTGACMIQQDILG